MQPAPLQALAEWRSIQDTVQLTFKAFFDTLKTQVYVHTAQGLQTLRCCQMLTALVEHSFLFAPHGTHARSPFSAACNTMPFEIQGEAIKSLEKSKDELAFSLRSEIASSLQRKANAPEVSGRLAEVGFSG